MEKIFEAIFTKSTSYIKLKIIFIGKIITDLKILLILSFLKLHFCGWNIRQNHSIPIWRKNLGARFAFPVRKSKLPPTPIANLIVSFFWEFMNISWSGAPKLQRSTWHLVFGNKKRRFKSLARNSKRSFENISKTWNCGRWYRSKKCQIQIAKH